MFPNAVSFGNQKTKILVNELVAYKKKNNCNPSPLEMMAAICV